MNAVMNPITDSTRQSPHVDEYLGRTGSNRRKGASTHFGQMRGEIRRCDTKDKFNALFCEGS